ncbi:MAG: cobalamin biosynthesis protein [Pseudomonadota bacterium]
MIVAGFGFRQAATTESLADALDRAAASRWITAIATAEDKAKAQAFQSLGASLDVPIHAMDARALAEQPTVTRSRASMDARGTGSLCEAAALAAAGPGARLIVPRVVSRDGMATCALAERGET